MCYNWYQSDLFTERTIPLLYFNDTIAAPATAPGQGGIAIIRVSGPQAESALRTLFSADVPFESHKLYYGHIQWENEVLDECMAVLMRAPRTYTREDVAELHLHGGSYASRKVLAALYALGIRAAEPGEFTRRAFLNGRIDLSRAEAVMGVISSESDRAARAAMRQLSGGVNSFIKSAQDELLSLLAGVEAALDYPEEISDEEAYPALEESARVLADRLDRACDERGARILESGLDVVLCGRPNVGKSSILNALLGQERAIVTNIPGTTRDIVQGSIQLEGVKVNLSDTAGLRDGSDEVEKIGIDKARKAIAHADVTVVVLDAAMPLTDEDLTLLHETENSPRIIVLNKIDRMPVNMLQLLKDALYVSARTGEGMQALQQAIAAFAANAGQSELSESRHMNLAREAARHLRSAADVCARGDEVDLAAIDLHAAIDALSRVTGEQVDERLLDDIFSRFCVGK